MLYFDFKNPFSMQETYYRLPIVPSNVIYFYPERMKKRESNIYFPFLHSSESSNLPDGPFILGIH